MKKITLHTIIFFFSFITILVGQDIELPRVMVVVDEKIDDQSTSAKKVVGKIEEALLERGFRLVDKAQFGEILARDLSLDLTNPAKAKALGKRFGAEIIITGGVQANFGGDIEVYGTKYADYTADGSVKIILTDVGEILAVSSADAKAKDQSKSRSASKSLEDLGKKLATDVVTKIDKKLKDMRDKPIVIQLALLGVNDASLLEEEKKLPSKIPMIQKLKVRYIEGDIAMLDLTVKGTIDDLRAQFTSLGEYKVVGFTGSRLDVSTDTKGVKKVSAYIPSELEILEFKVENIFPAQFNYYAFNPIGNMIIENTGKNDIKNVKVSVMVPKYMQLASEEVIPLLKAKEKKEIPVKATLDNTVLQDVKDNIAAQVQGKITFVVDGQEKSRSITKTTTIYSRNSVSWNRPDAIGAFITPNDEAVKNFSRFVIGNVKPDKTAYPDAPRNLMNAMAVWDAIRAFQINYVVDPWRVAEGDVLDDIQFPRETLANKAGDCDDSSVLLASCLENIGIRTFLIGTSDHVFIMFDTGVNAKNASRVSLNEREYIVKDNTVWIPLETTIIGKPFTQAWSMGAEGYYKTVDANGKLDMIDVRKSWEKFPPSNLASNVKTSEPPSAEKIASLLNEELINVITNYKEQIKARVAAYKVDGTEKSAQKASQLLANAGRFDEALEVIKKYSSATSTNNRANIYLLKGDSANAYNNYTAALKSDTKDGGINLNFGLLQFLGGNPAETVESFATAVKKFPSKEEAFTKLGIDNIVAEMGQTRAAEKTQAVDKGELKNLLISALQDVNAKKDSKANGKAIRKGENKFIFGGRRGIDPTALGNIKDFLYWKEI
ncbi:MAG: hypothetical protein EXR24_00845 [Ignavibacteria bacterium]|nr:hypothetical protein [Bacteroidota bacterium]MSQ45518.1 hypothetical protein [Ignavibacteria bacterium]